MFVVFSRVCSFLKWSRKLGYPLSRQTADCTRVVALVAAFGKKGSDAGGGRAHVQGGHRGMQDALGGRPPRLRGACGAGGGDAEAGGHGAPLPGGDVQGRDGVRAWGRVGEGGGCLRAGGESRAALFCRAARSPSVLVLLLLLAPGFVLVAFCPCGVVVWPARCSPEGTRWWEFSWKVAVGDTRLCVFVVNYGSM